MEGDQPLPAYNNNCWCLSTVTIAFGREALDQVEAAYYEMIASYR